MTSWSQLTIDVPEHLTDAIIGELSDIGVAGVWESSEPAPGQTRLVVYFDEPGHAGEIRACIHSIFDRARLADPPITEQTVARLDWTEEWRKSYVAFPIGSQFYVIPSWSSAGCPDDRLPIRIDPGQAFGTGTHETTQLTLESIERWLDPKQTVLDLGAGSAILAIACRLLGAARVFACDIDLVAVEVAAANLGRNHADSVSVFCGSIEAVRAHSMDLVLCNLTADLIVRLFSDIDRVLSPSGYAIFSGILSE
jgi:ribosomal protein L11 methyltransferase